MARKPRCLPAVLSCLFFLLEDCGLRLKDTCGQQHLTYKELHIETNNKEPCKGRLFWLQVELSRGWDLGYSEV